MAVLFQQQRHREGAFSLRVVVRIMVILLWAPMFEDAKHSHASAVSDTQLEGNLLKGHQTSRLLYQRSEIFAVALVLHATCHLRSLVLTKKNFAGGRARIKRDCPNVECRSMQSEQEVHMMELCSVPVPSRFLNRCFALGEIVDKSDLCRLLKLYIDPQTLGR
jgi:hypothetical protein